MLSIKRCRIQDEKSEPSKGFYYPSLINIYPKTSANDTIISKINEEIKQDILCFKELVETEDDIINYSHTDYRVPLKKKQIISIIELFEELSGTQSISYVNAYNYDLSQNKKLELRDIFKSDSEYLDIISIDIQSQINQIVGNMESIYTELSFEDANDFIQIYEDQTFYIEPDKVVICFSSYELGHKFPNPIEVSILFCDYEEYLTDYAMKEIWEGGY